ncbi:MAG: hypothetical protein H7A45_21095 [Verrucomicrobiales bacterium]|nr:hypothetical protein [Verrucomicrobiales bacterium]
MRALSLLAKVCAAALWSGRPGTSVILWLVGGVLDGWLAWRETSAAGRRWATLLRDVLGFNLSALVVAMAVRGACEYAAVRWKEGLPGVGMALAAAAHAVGLPVSERAGELYLTTMAGALRFTGSLDHLGAMIPALTMALSGVVLLWQGVNLKQVFRRLAGVTGLVAVVVIGQWLLATGLFLALCDQVGYETEELPVAPFFKPETALVLYAFLFLAVAPLWAALLGVPRSERTVAAGRWVMHPVLATSGLLLLGLGVCWRPEGRLKDGEVLINTFHTEWSRTDRPYDRDWYGADSGYNYAVLKRWYRLFGNVRELQARITAADLERASVLIIYLPNQPLSEEERRLVVEFVRRGGGLLLIGDHTNVFGSASHLNEIAEPFGFRFRDDVLFDLDRDFFQLIDLPGWHSAFTHGMTFFKFRGPASIQPTSLFTRVGLTVGHSKSLRAIYSVNNFYPPPRDHPKMMTGTFAVAVSSHFGRGRVAAFADSTIFSNFEIFYPGKYEYLLNTLHWLNHEDDTLGAFRQRTSLLGLLGFLAFLLARMRQPRRWLEVIALTLVAWGGARLVVAGIEHHRGRFPEPVRPAQALFFAAGSEDPAWGLRTFSSEADYHDRFEVFTQWVLRTGAFSGFHLLDEGASNLLYEHLRRSGQVQTAVAVVVRQPEELGRLRALANGPLKGSSRVLLMFASGVSWEMAGKTLRETGLLDDPALVSAGQAWPNREALVESNGRRILVVADAARFSDQAMGFSEKVVPTPAQRALFDEAFRLVDRLFDATPGTMQPGAAALSGAGR